MELKFVVIDLEAGLGAEEVEEAWGFGEEEAQSKVCWEEQHGSQDGCPDFFA